jgi:hypothetical protein
MIPIWASQGQIIINKKFKKLYIYRCKEINSHDKNVEVHDNVTFKFKSKINAVSSRVKGWSQRSSNG